MPERQPSLFPETRGVSGVLTDTEIEEAVQQGWLIVNDTFRSNCLEASSYDIRVGAYAAVSYFPVQK